MYLTVCKTRGNHKPKGKNPYNTTQDVCMPYLSLSKPLFPSLRKHPFLLALRRWRRFTRRKFHTDDANQCLPNESGSHGVPNINLSNFACLLVDFGEVLCSSANELQQNSNASSREDYIPEILTALLEILRVYI